MQLLRGLALSLSDMPCWVETRWLLLSGRCDVVGADVETRGFVVRAKDLPLLSVVGDPGAAALEQCADLAPPDATLLTQKDAVDTVAGILSGWVHEPAYLHTLPTRDMRRRQLGDGARVGLLSPEELAQAQHVPESLHRELLRATDWSPIAAVWWQDVPVSFCYAYAITETLWDVSVDTLDGHRMRGFGAAAVEFLAREMWKTGRSPVWGAVESNRGSLFAASRLGFLPTDRIEVFRRA